MCNCRASLIMSDSLLTPTPLENVRHITALDVIPGLELLLDGVMLPRLNSLCVTVVPLFVSLANRADQMKTLDTIEHLTITDQIGFEERCFSLKQWYLVFDAFPRLQKLHIQFQNPKCPPMAMVDLLIDYIRRARETSFTLLSCYVHHDMQEDTGKKEHFVTCLEDKLEIEFSSILIAIIDATRFNAWF